MLEVVKYLKSDKTLDDLKSEFAIKYSFDEKRELVILNYDQIESPKTHPIVMECRSLILEVNTWEIISQAFYRFFNYGEANTNNFDFSNAVILEKIDGSLIHFFNYKDEWRMATRGIIDGNNKVGDFNITFKDLFDLALTSHPYLMNAITPTLNYTFELVSVYNKIVTSYKNTELYLINARNKKTGKELHRDELEIISDNIGCKIPKLYHLNNLNDIKESFKQLNSSDEGYVCVDYNTIICNTNFSRVKVKNPSYLALAHLKGKGSTNSSILTLIRKGEEEELISVFPEYKLLITNIKLYWEKYIIQFNEIYTIVIEYFNKEKTKDNKKEFALKIKNSIYAPILFSIYDNKCSSIKEYYDMMDKRSSEKLTSKKILEILNIKDIEYKLEE